MDDDTRVEALRIRRLAQSCGHKSVDDLIAQQDADLKQFRKAIARTPEEIRERLLEMLTVLIEVNAEYCEQERWRTGVEGAIVEGRMSILREILDWMLGIRCSECGHELADGSNFCNHCGASTVKITLERVD